MKAKTYECIKHRGKVLAIIIRAGYSADKTTFFSSPEFSQQLGLIVYKKGGVIKAHCHKEVHRNIILTQEVLFVRKGKMVVNLYSENRKPVTSRQLGKGDIIFLCSGGHGFKMFKDSELLEIKQGPYSGRAGDKVIFEGAENDTGQ